MFEIPGGVGGFGPYINVTSLGSRDAAIAAIIVPGAVVPNGVEMTPYSIGQILTAIKFSLKNIEN